MPYLPASVASVDRRRPSARSADPLPKRASTSYVLVKPGMHSSAAAAAVAAAYRQGLFTLGNAES